MPTIIRAESPTGFYHIMQRGVGKQIIFEDDFDYKVYLSKISSELKRHPVAIIAYCLMDNHVHMILQSENPVYISRFMQKIGTSYAKYYNGKYDHSGHVFQNKYKSKTIKDERYLFACIRYIHNNPVEAGISSQATYKWSSYSEYILKRGICNREILLSMLGESVDFVKFSLIKDKDEFDYISIRNKNATYDDGLRIIGDCLGIECNDATFVKRLRKSERDRIIHSMKEYGLTNRQIEHMTGISRSIVQRA